MFKSLVFSVLFLSISLISTACNGTSAKTIAGTELSTDTTRYGKLDTAYFASGCFWCVEAIYERLYGVKESVSGYSGGKTKNPTYEEVGGDRTGHAEAVMIFYDPKLISYESLVKVYFGSQNPTDVNGQAPDFGSAYRSIIFYRNAAEQKIAEDFKRQLGESGKFSAPIAAEIIPFTVFYEAEDYHQNYEKLNPNNSYVRGISIPRLRRMEAKFPELLKK